MEYVCIENSFILYWFILMILQGDSTLRWRCTSFPKKLLIPYSEIIKKKMWKTIFLTTIKSKVAKLGNFHTLLWKVSVINKINTWILSILKYLIIIVEFFKKLGTRKILINELRRPWYILDESQNWIGINMATLQTNRQKLFYELFFCTFYSSFFKFQF